MRQRRRLDLPAPIADAPAAVPVDDTAEDVDVSEPDEGDAVSAIESLEPIEDDGAEPDVDVQAVLDAEPCSPRTPARKPAYKPGTRQVDAVRERAAAGGSWWTRADADFDKEAQRMRDQPTKLKVPAEHNVISWNAVF